MQLIGKIKLLGARHRIIGQAKCLSLLAIQLAEYRVALNFCGSLILRIGDFLCFAGTNFCVWKRLVFLAGN